jgi:hypothetical protein
MSHEERSQATSLVSYISLRNPWASELQEELALLKQRAQLDDQMPLDAAEDGMMDGPDGLSSG